MTLLFAGIPLRSATAEVKLAAYDLVAQRMPILFKLQSAVSLLTCGCLVSLAASPTSIGFVVTRGQAQVDGTFVYGNSTLFQGSLVDAGEATSDLMFPGGSNLLLQPGSSARVYRDYAVLENGTATQHGSQGYLLADGLKVSTLSPLGAVVVGVRDRAHLDVTAQSAGAEIRNPAGVLVARLEAGKALLITLQAPQNGVHQGVFAPELPQISPSPGQATSAIAAGTQLTLHGIIRKDHAGRYGHYLLTDLSTNVTYELQGSGLDDLVGGSAEATGTIIDTPAAAGASRVLSVSDIHQMPLSEMSGSNIPGAANVPNPGGDTPAPSTEGAEVSPSSEASAPAATPTEAETVPQPPPLPVHSDTAKIIVIVAVAAGVGVGVALGLAGGKSSTVSPE